MEFLKKYFIEDKNNFIYYINSQFQQGFVNIRNINLSIDEIEIVQDIFIFDNVKTIKNLNHRLCYYLGVYYELKKDYPNSIFYYKKSVKLDKFKNFNNNNNRSAFRLFYYCINFSQWDDKEVIFLRMILKEYDFIGPCNKNEKFPDKIYGIEYFKPFINDNTCKTFYALYDTKTRIREEFLDPYLESGNENNSSIFTKYVYANVLFRQKRYEESLKQVISLYLYKENKIRKYIDKEQMIMFLELIFDSLKNDKKKLTNIIDCINDTDLIPQKLEYIQGIKGYYKGCREYCNLLYYLFRDTNDMRIAIRIRSFYK